MSAKKKIVTSTPLALSTSLSDSSESFLSFSSLFKSKRIKKDVPSGSYKMIRLNFVQSKVEISDLIYMLNHISSNETVYRDMLEQENQFIECATPVFEKHKKILAEKQKSKSE